MFSKVIGLVAACFTMFAFIPQISRALKTRSVKDVSPITLSQLSIGVLLWIIYGILRRDAIIIIANAVTLSSLIILLVFYFKYGRRRL